MKKVVVMINPEMSKGNKERWKMALDHGREMAETKKQPSVYVGRLTPSEAVCV